jgi:hypothetical protein
LTILSPEKDGQRVRYFFTTLYHSFLGYAGEYGSRPLETLLVDAHGSTWKHGLERRVVIKARIRLFELFAVLGWRRSTRLPDFSKSLLVAQEAMIHQI